MSDHTETTDGGTTAAASRSTSTLPEARWRATRWPGWVWAIPLAALIFVGWLAAKSWLFGPPEVTVHFRNAAGVSVGAAVQYKGVQVGHVTEVRLDADRHRVDLVLSLEGPWDGHPGKRTRFWIVRPDLASGQIQKLIGGAYVAMQPGAGAETRDFTGLAAPPIRAVDRPGRTFVLTSADAGKVSQNTPVVFHGTTVGRVTGVRFDAKDRQARIHVFVRKKYAPLVRRETVFWQSGGLSVTRNAAGLNIDIPSISSLVSGAIAFRTPEVFAGPRAETGHRFALYASRNRASAVANGPRVAFSVRFPGAVGGLSPGAAVMLGSTRVGRVTKVGLAIDADHGTFATPVGIVLDARAFQLHTDQVDTKAALRKRLVDRIAGLVGKGLRARLGSSGLLARGKPIELAVVEDAKPATLDRSHEPPRIPTAKQHEPDFLKTPNKQKNEKNRKSSPSPDRKASETGSKKGAADAKPSERKKPGDDASPDGHHAKSGSH